MIKKEAMELLATIAMSQHHLHVAARDLTRIVDKEDGEELVPLQDYQADKHLRKVAIRVRAVANTLKKAAFKQSILTSGRSGERAYTGEKCSVCREPQFHTPAGDTCANRHGGAPPLEE